MGCHSRFLLLVLVLILLLQLSTSWSLFSNQGSHSNKKLSSSNAVSEFSMESLKDPKAIRVLENAKNKMFAPNSCWQSAYQNVFEGCSKILADEELRSRLAWHLSDCFQRHTGRPSFPHCDSKSSMKKCLMKLDTDGHKIYLEYFLETNSICHQLQNEVFKRQTERLVNDLKNTAEYAEVKLSRIEEHGELLLQNSKQVQDSLSSVDLQTQQVAKTSKIVEDHASSVLKYSESVYEQSKQIAALQNELTEGQSGMKANLVEGMTLIQESYNNLGGEIINLRNEAIEIEREIGKVGDAMFSKMDVLQSKADDIGTLAGTSLDKQKELLDDQSVALDGIQFLTRFQTQALEESRLNVQKLAEFGHKQQEELLERQKQLHQSHDHLVENSKLILAAQEEFESKQARMFVALDKLFALHSTMLFESRALMAFFVYSIAIFVIYMLTSVKQAYNVRHRLYLGLCVTFLIEISVLRTVAHDVQLQGKIIHIVRSLFMLLASLQYMYSIFTYRDYERLNHRLLLTIMDKVNIMQQGNKGLISWDMNNDNDDESDVNWALWVDTELPDEVNILEDLDYLLPGDDGSSVTSRCSKRYNLRKRC